MHQNISTATFCGIFVVEQKDKLRPIIDQRHPNSFTTKVHFKMDSLRDVCDLIRQGEFMFKIDLKDAYLHIKFCQPHWKFGAFWWKGIDGSKIWSHFPPADTYNASCEPKEVSYSVKNYKDQGRADQSLYVFGHGDGGGGPTEKHLEFLKRGRLAPGYPEIA